MARLVSIPDPLPADASSLLRNDLSVEAGFCSVGGYGAGESEWHRCENPAVVVIRPEHSGSGDPEGWCRDCLLFNGEWNAVPALIGSAFEVVA